MAHGKVPALPVLIVAGLSMALSSPVNATDGAGAQDPVARQLAGAGSPGDLLYQQHCAMCHDNPTGRTPARTFLSLVTSPDSIVAALRQGAMRAQASGLDVDQINSIAVYLTGREPGSTPQADPLANLCKTAGPAIAPRGSEWNGWSPDLENSRYQSVPGFKAKDVSRLKLKWAFAYPDTAYGQPVIVAGRVYITSRAGWVFSLDAETGCTNWAVNAGAPVRTALTIGPISSSVPAKFAAYFGDEKGGVQAFDAVTGKRLWQVSVDDHPLARITAAPKLYRGRLYVPVSSMEEASGRTLKYPCCTFRGSLAALDAATGRLLWKSYMITEQPAPTRLNSAGVQMYGPAGAGIWGAPAIDEKRRRIYVGTGDSYTDVPTDSTDAILAFDLETGKRVWTTQVRKDDNWLVGCEPGYTPDNCPKAPGPDFDFGAAPILHTLADGKQIILAAAKSGVAYGFDPDNRGKIIWRRRIGEGNAGGGVVWGMSADATNLYAAMADAHAKPPYAPGGVTALNAATGKVVWHSPAPAPVCGWGSVNCAAAQPAAVTVVPGLVFAGSWDGHMRGYAAGTGAIVWDFDTGRAFDAVNGVKAIGGAIDMGGEAIAGGLLLVNSGAAATQHPGNALLAFKVDDQ